MVTGVHRYRFVKVTPFYTLFIQKIYPKNILPFTGVECGDLPITASSNRSVPRVAVLSREVGGRAAFSCRSGYGIRGPSESICLPTGEWSLPFPDCVGMHFIESTAQLIYFN